MGTVVVQYGDQAPEPHICDLPEEAVTGTIVECEDCGQYWQCEGQRITCNFEGEILYPKWYKMGLFSVWYYVWRRR